MSTQDKEYTVYIRSKKKRVPVTKEEFDTYYKDVDVFRRKQQRHGKCVCPQNNRLSCDMNCATCPYRCAGDERSLDFTGENEDGDVTSWSDSLAIDEPLLEDIVATAVDMKTVLDRISTLMPEAIEIGKLRLEGLSDTEIAKRIGIPRTTFLSRLKALKATMLDEYPEIL